jgi:transposase
MAYSSDLRKKVLAFIAKGDSKNKVAKRFSISRTTLYTWLKQPNPLMAKKTGPKGMRCLDLEALKAHVIAEPDLYHDERAKYFNVSKTSIGKGLKRLGFTRKKNDTL